jgi:fatty-acyl-CoA synthase
MLVSAYGVPAPDSGDQVMVALVLRDGAAFDAASFAAWLDAQADLSPKWQPRFVRVCKALPSTPTNKILTRSLAHEKFRSDRVHSDAVYLRARGEGQFRLFGEEEESSLRDAFTSHGRRAAWDL